MHYRIFHKVDNERCFNSKTLGLHLNQSEHGRYFLNWTSFGTPFLSLVTVLYYEVAPHLPQKTNFFFYWAISAIVSGHEYSQTKIYIYIGLGTNAFVGDRSWDANEDRFFLI